LEKYLHFLRDSKVRKLKDEMYENHFSTNFRLKNYVKKFMPKATNKELSYED
jgi:hypothetical protein